MNFIKNIFWVSYLKNKGVRRICFILGILLAITPTYIWYEDLSNNFYSETYENIIAFGKENKYNTNKQKEVYNKYPADIGAKNLSNFNDWQNFMFDDYGDGYKARRYYLEQCYILKQIETKVEIPEGFHIVNNPKENDYWSQFEEVKPAPKKEERKTLAEIFQDDEGYQKLQEFCPKFKQYMTQEISISKANYLYLLKLLWSLLWFYLPFLLSCIIKWVYTGFKEK